MAINSLSPAFIKLYYVAFGAEHVQVLPTKFSGAVVPGATPSVELHNGTSLDGADAVDAYSVVFAAWIRTTDSILRADFWSQPTPQDDPIFVSSAPLGIPGLVSATVQNQSVQSSITFRSAFGGLYRNIVVDQTLIPVNVRDDAPFSNASVQNYVNFLMNPAQSFVYARDGGKLISPIRLLTKTNDILRKRRLVNT